MGIVVDGLRRAGHQLERPRPGEDDRPQVLRERRGHDVDEAILHPLDLAPPPPPHLVVAKRSVLRRLDVAGLNHAQHLAAAFQGRAEHGEGDHPRVAQPAVTRVVLVPSPRHKPAHAVGDDDQCGRILEVRMRRDARVQFPRAPADVPSPVVPARDHPLVRDAEPAGALTEETKRLAVQVRGAEGEGEAGGHIRRRGLLDERRVEAQGVLIRDPESPELAPARGFERRAENAGHENDPEGGAQSGQFGRHALVVCSDLVKRRQQVANGRAVVERVVVDEIPRGALRRRHGRQYQESEEREPWSTPRHDPHRRLLPREWRPGGAHSSGTWAAKTSAHHYLRWSVPRTGLGCQGLCWMKRRAPNRFDLSSGRERDRTGDVHKSIKVSLTIFHGDMFYTFMDVPR